MNNEQLGKLINTSFTLTVRATEKCNYYISISYFELHFTKVSLKSLVDFLIFKNIRPNLIFIKSGRDSPVRIHWLPL